MSNSINILIVEDEIIPAQYLKETLEDESFTVYPIVDNAQDAYQSVLKNPIDIVFMDIMIKGSLSGIEVATMIRQYSDTIKIVFLTAYAHKEMVGGAKDVKASAYLMKPYRMQEIIATAHLLSIQQEPKHDEVIQLVDGFSFNMKTDSFYKHSADVKLSKNARKLIQILCEAKGVVVSAQTITRLIWENEPSPQALRSLIFRLREQLGENIITNSSGFGYKINVLPS